MLLFIHVSLTSNTPDMLFYSNADRPFITFRITYLSPHPGNLLRTTDGRLCILDWGMTLEVPKDLQYGLLDFIAHINAEDFESLPEDFVNLGFTPPNKLEQVSDRQLPCICMCS